MSPPSVSCAQEVGVDYCDTDDEIIRPTRSSTVNVTYGSKKSPRTKRVSEGVREKDNSTDNKKVDRSRNKIGFKSEIQQHHTGTFQMVCYVNEVLSEQG